MRWTKKMALQWTYCEQIKYWQSRKSLRSKLTKKDGKTIKNMEDKGQIQQRKKKRQNLEQGGDRREATKYKEGKSQIQHHTMK